MNERRPTMHAQTVKPADEAVAAAPPQRRAPNARARRPWLSKRWAPYLFISPFFIVFAVFGLFPLLFSIYLSFHRWDPAEGLAAMRFVAFENYLYVLQDDEWFHQSIYNTLWLSIVSGLPQHLVALPLDRKSVV